MKSAMLNQSDIVEIIQTIPWFSALQLASIKALAALAEIKSCKCGEIIFTEGEQDDYLYIVLEGKISLERYIPTIGVIPMYTAETLDVIGWSCLTPIVRQKTASACVVADARLLVLDARGLAKLCEHDHDLGYTVYKRLANVISSRLLVSRLQLSEIISRQAQPVKN